ncbi:MAG TPA: hypothetical protein VIT91_03835 [Chthoniobacterales bacterium]
MVLASGKETVLDLRQGNTFDVARLREIEISPGDKILIRANNKQLGLINGQVLTVAGIEPDGSLRTNESISVPAQFRQWCHGYVVTSHKAQGWTADHVVVAAERITAKGAYVACSRGRHSCTIHTPDKLWLVEKLPEGNRKTALDVLPGIQTHSAAILNRVSQWKKIAAVARKIAQRWMRQSPGKYQAVASYEQQSRLMKM